MKDKILLEMERILIQIERSKDINVIKLLVKRAINLLYSECDLE